MPANSRRFNQRAKKPAAVKAAAPPPPPSPVPIPEVQTMVCDLVDIMGLNKNTCRWPFAPHETKAPFWLYCGRPKKLERSYCREHWHESLDLKRRIPISTY
jgi:hypothetical protein